MASPLSNFSPQTMELNTKLHWWDRFKPHNWLYETRNQELERRLRAVESSTRNAHDRINDLDLRKANRDSDNHPSL